MRVLITGATGFLGSHISRALAARGDVARVLIRPGSPLDLLDGIEVEQAVGDILEPPSLGPACDGVHAVIHCAAQMQARGRIEARLASHVDGTRHLLAAARRAGVRRFVYASSVASLGMPPHSPAPTSAGIRPLDETHQWVGPPSSWSYGYAKLQAEALVREAASDGLGAVIVNPALVIGPGDRNRVSNGLIWHMVRGRIPPRIPGGLNVVHFQDVVDGFLGALDGGRSGERYLLCGENRSLGDVVETTARLLDLRPPRWELPLGPVRTIGSLLYSLTRLLRLRLTPDLLLTAGKYFYYDGAKARRELGLADPRPYEDAAVQSAAWYRLRRSS